MRGFLILSLSFAIVAGTATLSSAQQRFDAARLLTDVKTLSSDPFEGRDAGSVGGERAREYLREAYSSIGLAACGAEYNQPFNFETRDGNSLSGVNMIGLIPGAYDADHYLVLTAHYDHVGIRNGEIYNGADDNASGTAALVAIASYFLRFPPDHSIVIVALDAEEKGLRGARAFVSDPCVPLESIVMNVNLDMIGRNEKRELYVAGTSHYPELRPLLEGLAADRPMSLLLGHDSAGTGRNDWTFSSDHGAFHREGIPFLYFGVEDHDDYHRPTDDFEGIMPAFYIDVVDTILDTILALDENLEGIRLVNGR